MVLVRSVQGGLKTQSLRGFSRNFRKKKILESYHDDYDDGFNDVNDFGDDGH